MQIAHNKNMEINKMKTFNILTILVVFALSACSTSSHVYDDIYYSRNKNTNYEQQMASAPDVQKRVVTQSTNGDYEYQSYYQDNAASQVQSTSVNPVYTTNETIIEPDGTSYSTTETYYDSDYASRFRRFDSGLNSSFGYYDGYNSNCYNCSGSSFGLSYGYPYGLGLSYSYGYPYHYSNMGYYNSFFYDPWYSPWYGYGYGYYNPWRYNYWGYGGYYGYGYGSYWAGYRHGFYDGYYYGNNIDNPFYWKSSSYVYGPRATTGGGTTVASGAPRGNRSDNIQGNSIGNDRGTRINDPAVGTSARAAERGSSVQSGEARGSAVNRGTGSASGTTQDRQQTVTRATRPGTSAGQSTRPSTQDKVSEYRQRYDRPASSNAQSRTQQYERPRSYTSPSTRQPKSSNEYVRPQATPRQNSGTINRNQAPVQRQTNTVRSQSAPARSSGTSNSRSYSAPSNNRSSSYSAPARSSSPSYSAPARSSSSGSSSGASRGSSSSSTSSGGRR